MARDTDPAKERREDLLEATYALIAEKGLEGLRTREIAARAGVNISTLHYYFGTKEALLAALLEHVGGKFAQAHARRPVKLKDPAKPAVKLGDTPKPAVKLGDTPKPAVKLGDTPKPPAPRSRPTVVAHLEAAWRSFETTPHLSTVLQELVLRAERDPDARAAFKKLHLLWNGMVEEILREGVENGELRDDLDARSAARIVTSFIIGALVQLGVNKKAFDFDGVAGELIRLMARPAR
jgi:AcrR family transcriptional regulator